MGLVTGLGLGMNGFGAGLGFSGALGGASTAGSLDALESLSSAGAVALFDAASLGFVPPSGAGDALGAEVAGEFEGVLLEGATSDEGCAGVGVGAGWIGGCCASGAKTEGAGCGGPLSDVGAFWATVASGFFAGGFSQANP